MFFLKKVIRGVVSSTGGSPYFSDEINNVCAGKVSPGPAFRCCCSLFIGCEDGDQKEIISESELECWDCF